MLYFSIHDGRLLITLTIISIYSDALLLEFFCSMYIISPFNLLSLSEVSFKSEEKVTL
ncbi:hypothetical protein [Azospirillum palustre]